MDKMEILEMLKNKIYYRINASEMTEEEINKIVKQCFDGIEQILEEYHCSNEAILDYIYGNYNDSKNNANIVIQNRKEELLEKVNLKINRMIDEVDEKGKIEDKTHRSSLENINLEIDDSKDTVKIIDKIVDNLADIKSQVSKILYNRGYSDSRIEQIMSDVNAYIRRVENSKGQDIYEVLKQDGKQKAEDIVEQYELIEEQLTEIKEEVENEPEKDKEPSNNELAFKSFREGLNSGVSLEEQAKNTEKFVKEIEEEQKHVNKKEESFVLRGDILE